MARIAGVNVPTNKRVVVALTYVYGIGRTTARKIVDQAGIDLQTRIKDLPEDKLNVIRDIITQNFKVEGDLRRDISLSIKRLTDLSCYRGVRHRKKLPVRGQRTRTNARTRKGKAVAIAGKKKAPAKK